MRAATGPRHQLQPKGHVSFADDYAEYCATKLAETEKDRWKSLAYEVMDDREDQIAEAEMKTFEWILQAPRGSQLPWSDFMQWLEAGESMYWIRGKAGSGGQIYDHEVSQWPPQSATSITYVVYRRRFYPHHSRLLFLV